MVCAGRARVGSSRAVRKQYAKLPPLWATCCLDHGRNRLLGSTAGGDGANSEGVQARIGSRLEKTMALPAIPAPTRAPTATLEVVTA